MAHIAKLAQSIGTSTFSEVATDKWDKGDHTRRLVIFCHGAGVNGNIVSGNNLPQRDVFSALMDTSRYMLVTTDIGGPATWGGDAAADAIEAARIWAMEHGAAGPKFALVGWSMGNASMMAYARKYGIEHLAGIIASIPVCDLNASFNRGTDAAPGGAYADINASFGVTNDTQWNAIRSKVNPTEFASTKCKGLIWHAHYRTDDTIEPAIPQVTDLATAIGSTAVLHNEGTGNHTWCITASQLLTELDSLNWSGAKQFGVSEPPWNSYEGSRGGGTGFDARMNELVALGCQWLRCDIDWNNIITNSGSWTNFAEWDDIVTRAHAKGLKVLAPLMAIPDDGTGSPTNPTSFIGTWLNSHQRPDAIEICNEQNEGNSGWNIAWGPVKYATFLSQAFDAIKAIVPTMPVYFGGLAAYGDGRTPHGFEDETTPNSTYPASYTLLVNDRNMDPCSYVHKVIDALATYKSTNGRFPWDAICFHPYSNWQNVIVSGSPASSLLNLVSTHNLCVSQGDPGIIICSEYGVTDNRHAYQFGQTDATIAQWTSDLVNWWFKQSWTSHFFWYTLDLPTTITDSLEASFGLMEPVASSPPLGARRPTWTSLQQIIAAHPS